MVKTLTIPISDDLHTEFKKYCLDRDITIREAVLLAIQLILKKR